RPSRASGSERCSPLSWWLRIPTAAFPGSCRCRMDIPRPRLPARGSRSHDGNPCIRIQISAYPLPLCRNMTRDRRILSPINRSSPITLLVKLEGPDHPSPFLILDVKKGCELLGSARLQLQPELLKLVPIVGHGGDPDELAVQSPDSLFRGHCRRRECLTSGKS